MASCLYCVVDGAFSAIPRLDLVLVPRMGPPRSCYPYKPPFPSHGWRQTSVTSNAPSFFSRAWWKEMMMMASLVLTLFVTYILYFIILNLKLPCFILLWMVWVMLLLIAIPPCCISWLQASPVCCIYQDDRDRRASQAVCKQGESLQMSTRFVFVYLFVFVFVYLFVYVHLCVCVFVCVCACLSPAKLVC